MHLTSIRLALILTLLALAACASPTTSRGSSQTSAQESARPQVTRTLVMAGRSEIPSLASRPLRAFGLTGTTTTRLFNAGLTLRDGDGNFRPYLAEALPQLNTD